MENLGGWSPASADHRGERAGGRLPWLREAGRGQPSLPFVPLRIPPSSPVSPRVRGGGGGSGAQGLLRRAGAGAPAGARPSSLLPPLAASRRPGRGRAGVRVRVRVRAKPGAGSRARAAPRAGGGCGVGRGAVGAAHREGQVRGGDAAPAPARGAAGAGRIGSRGEGRGRGLRVRPGGSRTGGGGGEALRVRAAVGAWRATWASAGQSRPRAHVGWDSRTSPSVVCDFAGGGLTTLCLSFPF